MNHASLTTRYRPQTFAELAGQTTLKAILSRAAAEDRVAPAYLFSGTRGVGKTTIARIFAKALNCRNPVKTGGGAEPCNVCDQCKAVTLGSSVDVVEIDGASNRGIDDVRKLKESVGYAPMEGRYKIFIIDEAHMLSREAFNALLKTLEEPPARVTFVMATTEPHKFPITIVSRCQHYVFKRLSDAELDTHLKKVLEAESQPYEEPALRLLVRRAAGSVRDAMSLLGQVLALGGKTLSENDVRAVLGLAGQELFFRLLAAVRHGDCAGLSLLVREMLDQGVDLGFFLRELTAMWRNLFMLRQIGAEAAGLVELPEAEFARWLAEARELDIAHIHACWQMTLEGQRRVLTSLEPALALELLLLNLAMLPRLMSMEQLSSFSRKVAANERPADGEPADERSGVQAEKKSPLNSAVAPPPAPSTFAARTTDAKSPPPAGDARQDPADAAPAFFTEKKSSLEQDRPNGLTDPANQYDLADMAERDARALLEAEADASPPFVPDAPLTAVEKMAYTPSARVPDESLSGSPLFGPEADGPDGWAARPETGALDADEEDELALGTGPGLEPARAGIYGDWNGFLAFCQTDAELAPSLAPLFACLKAEWSPAELCLTPPDEFSSRRLAQKSIRDTLAEQLRKFCGRTPLMRFLPPPEAQNNRDKIRAEVEQLPIVQALKEKLAAEYLESGPWYDK